MLSRQVTRLAAVAIVIATFTAQAVDAPPGSAYDSPSLNDITAQKPALPKEPLLCGIAKQSVTLPAGRHLGIPLAGPIWAQNAGGADEETGDALWETRYVIYQELISQGSTPLFRSSGDYLESEDGTPICLLHGRSDVLANADLIRSVSAEYPAIAPVMVAAAIAEQASDVERLFGLDILEMTTLFLPGKDDMSVGIAQIRPTEAISLGVALDPLDLFDPEVAVRGMVAKLRTVNERIDLLQDPEAPISLTERYILLLLGQNSPGVVDSYFELGGDWTLLLSQNNNARAKRYFLVHLDWLIANGWDLPEDVDLDLWRTAAFTALREVD